MRFKKAKAAGTIVEAVTLESVDLNKVREMGNKVDFSLLHHNLISTLFRVLFYICLNRQGY